MIELTVSGFVELEQALLKLPGEVGGRVLDRALRKGGAPMEGAAQQGAPRSSNPGPNGHMADTIKLRKLPRTTDANLEAHLWLGPDSDHFYGLFGEFGTVHQTATPFMRPAFDQHVQETVTILGKELWAGIERAAKKYNRRRS